MRTAIHLKHISAASRPYPETSSAYGRMIDSITENGTRKRGSSRRYPKGGGVAYGVEGEAGALTKVVMVPLTHWFEAPQVLPSAEPASVSEAEAAPHAHQFT